MVEEKVSYALLFGSVEGEDQGKRRTKRKRREEDRKEFEPGIRRPSKSGCG